MGDGRAPGCVTGPPWHASFLYEVAFCALNLSAIMIYDCMKSFKLRFVWLSVSIKVTVIAIFLFPNKCSAEHCNSEFVYGSWQWLISVAKFFIFYN